MEPQASYDNEEYDPRFKELTDELIASKISREEALHLHMWLSSHADTHLISVVTEKAVGTLTHAEQINACIKLKKCASEISSQFSFLNQVSALEQVMSEVFICHETPHSTYPNGKEDWRSFRNRVLADAEILTEISRQTLTALRSRGSKKGRKPNEWRNRLLSELINRLGQYYSKSHEEVCILAHGIWNIYFPDDSIGEVESAGKIAARERKRQKRGGQNVA